MIVPQPFSGGRSANLPLARAEARPGEWLLSANDREDPTGSMSPQWHRGIPLHRIARQVAFGAESPRANGHKNGVEIRKASWSFASASAREVHVLLAILQAVDELASFSTVDGVINAAVEIGRSRLGLERVSFYLLGVSDQRLVLRGTRGTGSRGETTDERACQHEVSREDLRELEACGACGLYLERGPLLAREQGRCVQIALGWSVVMPLTNTIRYR